MYTKQELQQYGYGHQTTTLATDGVGLPYVKYTFNEQSQIQILFIFFNLDFVYLF